MKAHWVAAVSGSAALVLFVACVGDSPVRNASAQTGHTPSTAGDVSCETTGYCAFSPVQIPNFPP